MQTRLSTKYRPGTGDRGYTNYMSVREGDRIISKIEVRKDDPICFIYQDCEAIRLYLERFFRSGNQLQTEALTDELVFLQKNISCYAGFCHYLGDSPKCVFPERYVDKIDQLTRLYQDALENAPDFVHDCQSLTIISIYEINELVRKLETHYCAWRHHPHVIRNIYDFFADRPEDVVQLGQDILYMSTILNRLSKFLDAAARHENALLGLPETYWQAKINRPD